MGCGSSSIDANHTFSGTNCIVSINVRKDTLRRTHIRLQRSTRGREGEFDGVEFTNFRSTAQRLQEWAADDVGLRCDEMARWLLTHGASQRGVRPLFPLTA